MSKKSYIDKDAFADGEAPDTVEDRIAAGRPINSPFGGIAGTRPIVPAIQRAPTSVEKYIPGGSGAPHSAIIFGPQRNTNIASGQGFKGIPSDTIDLVAGLNSGGIAKNGQIVGVNPISDAARVYITRAVQVDTMFGIAREVLPGEEAEPIRSSVVMKADTARIIGRLGVKIITGKAQGAKGTGLTGEKNSMGGKYQQAATIDLIAGNNIGSHSLALPDPVKAIIDVIKPLMNWNPKVEYLQPVPRGDNLVEALRRALRCGGNNCKRADDHYSIAVRMVSRPCHRPCSLVGPEPRAGPGRHRHGRLHS